MNVRLHSLLFLCAVQVVGLISTFAFASTSTSGHPSKCMMTTQDTALNAQVEVTPMGEGCAVYVAPIQRSSMVYRSYLFTDDGLFQIFNSFGNGAESAKTGARVYAIFPRTSKVGYHISIDQKTVRVQTANESAQFKIHTSPQISVDAISGTEFQEDPTISEDNNGGLELTKNQFFYMDSGFGRGSAPQTNAFSVSTFHDTQGRQCVVANKKIFKYKKGNARLKSDKDIRTMLAQNCPQLKRF